MKLCRHCKHSVSRHDLQLVCLKWRMVCTTVCHEFEREPGADDEISQPDAGDAAPDHFHQPIQEIGR